MLRQVGHGGITRNGAPWPLATRRGETPARRGEICAVHAPPPIVVRARGTKTRGRLGRFRRFTALDAGFRRARIGRQRAICPVE